mgnify:CR=1 FL=1
MSDQAAISGDYCDLRFVKGRKVAQIIIEIPIEAAGVFVQAFGTPQPDKTVPVALARIHPPRPVCTCDLPAGSEHLPGCPSAPTLKQQLAASIEHEDTKAKRSWSELSRAQQAGIAANELDFQRFLSVGDADSAAQQIRFRCKVGSRREFDAHPTLGKRWDELYSQYRMWMAGARV